ncbi:Holliday junction branch migration protein RuvA [Candidatus Arthromitus sp. SFB-rat-Yit]|uniref:Holliday junction branch migration protein RuvA n=1 Tax=Candidatus Arthromitus sp. SFB-rat-Yit TaxID=1041504 RepID=UPI000227A16D|nr:Holliday junction branch migration protein RuvA [Candidatus Arthromitus sp. SFB-rat-Yit]BAK81291.1 Holliday junction DNA helicase RuvA [Candidatus Arthromitus sp. SFB-rat-Yit]
MYEYIEGIYKGLNKDYVIIENNGIGYKIFTSGNSICSMPDIDKKIKLYVEQIVREDFIGLYGFINHDELDMFLKLINISGIGAKAALSILSINTVDTLKEAIYYSDESMLMKANGVGKKTAQRIILELKDKIVLGSYDKVSEIIVDHKSNDILSESKEALLSLGFDDKSVNKVLNEVVKKFPYEPLEFIIKECLKNLMR